MNNNPASPCVGICTYAPLQKDDMEKVCSGCFRTAEEIEEWFHASATQKEIIIKSAKKRKFEEEYQKDLTIILRTSRILKD